MPPALEVRDLWKSFAVGVRGCSARISVLRGVSFHVGACERVGIVGGRAAGKTTLLHCIAGLRRPDRGSVSPVGPSSESIALIDEGMLDPGDSPVAALFFARAVDTLRGRVHRILLLEKGHVVQIEPGIDAPLLGRRVAEPTMPLCARTGTSVDHAAAGRLACRDDPCPPPGEEDGQTTGNDAAAQREGMA
jgi:energy-coupling factor transporter ATP-binding protein EcfA2